MNRILKTAELIDYMEKYEWKRKPQELHTHHTWQPDYADFNGKNHLALNEGMRSYHMGKGWDDIGQHLTLFPDGMWVIGRSWDKNPASIKGRNSLGFAVEMVGNFDKGKDRISELQLNAIVELWAFLCDKFSLDPKKNIIFHREYASKTCPGTGIDKVWFVNLVIEKMEDEMVKKVKGLIGDKKATAVLINGETFLRSTDVAAAMGKKATWDESTETVSIK